MCPTGYLGSKSQTVATRVEGPSRYSVRPSHSAARPRPKVPSSPPKVLATVAPPPESPTAFTYGARVHPQLAVNGLQLLSWNVSCSGDLLADASLYRPRFCAVPW